MQTNTFAILAIVGAAAAAVYATEPCNMSAIQGSLLPNGTAWHESCTAATGVDVFMMDKFPTKAQAKNISQSRDCVNYINQINQQANSAIQCQTTVGDQTVVLGKLLSDLLTGKTGNNTKEAVVGSDSMSGSTSLSSSASTSGSSSSSSNSSSASTAGSKKAKKKMTSSGSKVSSSSSSAADKQESSSKSGKSATSGASAAALSVVAAAATTVLAFAL